MIDVKKWITQVNRKLRSMIIKDPDFPTSTPSANYYSNNQDPPSVFAITDGDDSQVMYTQAYYKTNGERGMEVGSRKIVSGSTTQNYVALAFDSNDNPVVKVADASAWLAALGLTAQTYSFTMPSTLTFGNFAITRFGPVVSIIINNPTEIPTGSTTVCTVPAGWRPSYNTNCLLPMPSTSTPTANSLSLRVDVTPAGLVRIYNYRSAAITAATNQSAVLTYIATQ